MRVFHIYCILSPLMFSSCTEELKTEIDQYEVINQGYSDYIDSLNRNREIYYKFAVLRDSHDIESHMRKLADKNKETSVLKFYSEYKITYYEDSIDKNQMNNFELINSQYVDSNMIGSSEKLYAITRPYRPDSCELVAIQEHQIPSSTDCIGDGKKTLIFKKKNKRWRLIDIY
ncbi:MAG: hypothetical protein ABJG68_12715 [Crocinitomicaceae bacterium]